MKQGLILMLVCPLLVSTSAGQESADESADSRLEYMRGAVQSFRVTAVGRESEIPRRFVDSAILRFADPTRQASDGSLWKLGGGRPLAIVATEFTMADEGLRLQYEFLNLTEQKFALSTSQGWNWIPSDSAIRFKELKGVQPPADQSRLRLRQMRSIARRFEASEKYEGEVYQLRLMTQPIDVYQLGEASDSDQGAIFVFANGTNPEALLLIEAVGGKWQYGLARLCGAQPTVTLNGETIWTVPAMDQIRKSWRNNYTGEAHPVVDPIQ